MTAQNSGGRLQSSLAKDEKTVENIEKNQLLPLLGETAEALWSRFEETGSVETYLSYLRLTENPKKLERVFLPS
ncbi:MAG TPA: hypothetical protein VIJ93_10760 [bacterium]